MTIRNTHFQEGPNAPQTVEGSLAIYTLFELALYWSATNCLSDYRTGAYTGAIDGTAYPAITNVGTFAYSDDLITQLWMYTDTLTLTGPTHTAVLVCIFFSKLTSLELADYGGELVHCFHWSLLYVIFFVRIRLILCSEFLIASTEPVQTSTATTNVEGTLVTTTFSTVNLNPTFTTPSTVSTITPITTSSSTPASTGSSVSAGPIAGGVVGGIIVLGAIILFVWYKFFRGDHHHGHANNDNEDNDTSAAAPQRFKSINSGDHDMEIPMENMDEMPSARTREEGSTG